MLFYTNGSSLTKTFHGVTFKPGETKEVFGIINDPTFVPAFKEPPKCNVCTNSKSEKEQLLEAEPVKKGKGRSRKTSSAKKDSESNSGKRKNSSNKEV